jgi:hypothetical protein
VWGNPPFTQPKFVVVGTEQPSAPEDIVRLMGSAGFGFPVICKPVEACGTPNSHSMAVVVSAAGLDLVQPPCVVQVTILAATLFALLSAPY